MAPTSDEILAVEYMRFTAIKDSYIDWNATNPTHMRGPDGRFVDVPGVLQALGDMPSGEPGAGSARRAVRNRPLEIRPELARLRTKAAVQQHLRDQLQAVTGSEVDVDLGTRLHVATMREVAEGFLRSAEAWPDVKVARIAVMPRLPGAAPDAWSAHWTGPTGANIGLNERQLADRARFLARLRRTIESGDNRPTADNAAYIAAHEFAHLVQAQHVEAPGRSSEVAYAVLRAIPDVDFNDPGQRSAYIAGQLGSHTLHSQSEMGAEGLADVALNGLDAAPLSLAIHREIHHLPQQNSGDADRPANTPPAATPTPSRPTGPVVPAAPRRRASARLRIAEALNRWVAGHGDNEPLNGFDREPLRVVAREYGIALPRGASVENIRAALIDHTRRTVGERREAPSAELRSLADMLDDISSIRDEEVRAVFEGEFGGLRTKVKDWGRTFGRSNGLEVRGTVYDSSGRKVGDISQDYYRDRRGKLVAHHGLMTLDSRVQGSGFATAFGGHLLGWYQSSGVKELHTNANIDVGGYCVPMRARILTRRGWLKRDQIRHDDQTLGYHFPTATLKWTPILAVADFESLPMLRLQHRNWATECTPNHRWVVQRFASPHRKATWLTPQFMTADALAKHGRRIIVSAPAGVDDQSGLSPDEAALLGWLVTDGHVHRRMRPGRTNLEVTASIAQEKTVGRQALQDLGSRLGWQMTPRGCNVPAQQLRGMYRKLALPYGDDLRPHLEVVVLSMGTGQLQAFCEAGMLAEGDHNRARFWQKPGAVLDAFALAFFMTGHRVAVGVRASKGLGWLSISRPHVTSERLQVTDLGAAPAWCPQTGLGTWVMELDGHITLTGNTWARSGFDFASSQTARGVQNRLEGYLSEFEYNQAYASLGLRGAPDIAEQIRLGNELAARMSGRRLGDPDFPTAYEISQLGRWEGAGKDDMWIGKRALLGANWEAVLRL